MSAQPKLGNTPTLAEVIRAAVDGSVEGLHISFPAKVRAYHASTQTVDVTPTVAVMLRTEDGVTYENLPPVDDVPVCFPRASSFAVTFPIAAGDHVFCVVSTRDIGNWRVSGQTSNSGDQRPYALSGAIAIPGIAPSSAALSASSTDMILGDHSGSKIVIKPSGGNVEIAGGAQFVALANKVLTELQNIQTWAVSHTHVCSSPGSPGAVAAPALAAPASVAASKVKAT